MQLEMPDTAITVGHRVVSARIVTDNVTADRLTAP
jgi:hypothetical protein